MSGGSYYGHSSEIYNDDSPLHKLKTTYWETKHKVLTKVARKKEDEHLVASDAELDSKIETFKSIQRTSIELSRLLNEYDLIISRLAKHEHTCSRFVRTQSSQDKTRAGKMLQATGKLLSFASQQRLMLRPPISRLAHEVDTFKSQAVGDTALSLEKVEDVRAEYRAALLWMQDASKELNPDEYRRLDKFRKVQQQVKKKKERFDHLKIGVMQKVDMLAASRSNMFSHALEAYQRALLDFWRTTSQALTTVADAFEGYQYYEFNIVKELIEPTKKLAEVLNTPKVDEEAASIDAILEQLDRTLEELSKGQRVSMDSYSDVPRARPRPSAPESGAGAAEAANRQRLWDHLNAKTDALLNIDPSEVPEQNPLDDAPDPIADLSMLQDIIDISDDTNPDFDNDWKSFNTSEATGAPGAASANLLGEMGGADDFSSGGYMPSHLLELSGSSPTQGNLIPNLGGELDEAGAGASSEFDIFDRLKTQPGAPSAPIPAQQQSEKDKWFNMFAELDPLANPDAVGKNEAADLFQA